MTNLENFQSMVKNIDEFAKWLNENCGDDAAWIIWYDKNYCKKCDGIPMNEYPWNEYAYCEKYGRCRFFQEKNEVISMEEIIKLWLNREVD